MEWVHAGLELVGAALCFWIAWMSWKRYKLFPSGFLMLWTFAYVLAGAQDVLHAVLSVANTELVAYWVPWTWATGRFALAALLCVGLYGALKKIPKHVGMLAVVLAVGTSGALLALGQGFKFVYTDSIIQRPLDFALIWVWLGLLVLFIRVPAASIQAPRGFHVYLALGVAVHVVMAFGSSESLDAGFMVAHALKLLEYALWAGSLFCERGDFQEIIATRAAEIARDQPRLAESVVELGFPELRAKLSAAREKRRESTKRFHAEVRLILGAVGEDGPSPP